MPQSPKKRIGAMTAASCALGLAVALALIIDLSSPKENGGHAVTTAKQARPESDLASQMEAQIAAGAPGVALALEESASKEARKSFAVSAARAHALFEIGDAPSALELVRTSLRICDVTHGCTFGERAMLERLKVVIGAVVDAGVKDPRRDPKKVEQAVNGLLRPAATFLKD